MKKIYFADCETEPFKIGRFPQPFIWGLYGGDEVYEETYQEFYCDNLMDNPTKEFIEFISQEDCIVYAHNGGKFDWHFLINYIKEDTPLTIIDGRLSKFKIGKAEFRDSYNLMPIPLAEYQKDKFDYNKLERCNRRKHIGEIKKYLKNDCVYLHKLITEFIDTYGLHLTLAGTALAFWQNMTNEARPLTAEYFFNSFQPFYYGGRVECFQTGIIQKEFKVLDINSAYPYAMQFKHPYGCDIIETETLPKNKSYIGRSFITLEAESKGAFPFREKNGSLFFPADNVSRLFNITGWEYLAAKETDNLGKHKIIKCISFDKTIEFTEYVKHFYELKKTAKVNKDKAQYLFAKLLMNSLYGKFGSNFSKYKEYKTCQPANFTFDNLKNWEYAADFGDNYLVQRELSESKKKYLNICVSASITGFVRAFLFRALCQVKEPIYCDTDSIACVDSGNMIVGDKLGEWELEANCNLAAIAGKKLYAFRKLNGDYKIASKGCDLSAKEIIEIAGGAEILTENIAPTYSVKKDPYFTTRKIRKTS